MTFLRVFERRNDMGVLHLEVCADWEGEASHINVAGNTMADLKDLVVRIKKALDAPIVRLGDGQ